MKITRELISLNFRNLNNRIYLENNESVRNSIEQFNEKSKYGELNHPTLHVSLKDVSHKIDNLTIDGDKIIGDIEILDNPNGRILQDMIDDVVFRPIFIGVVEKGRIIELKRIVCFDAVQIIENDLGHRFIKPIPTVPKEVKRIYSELDPFGEEDWEV